MATRRRATLSLALVLLPLFPDLPAQADLTPSGSEVDRGGAMLGLDRDAAAVAARLAGAALLDGRAILLRGLPVRADAMRLHGVPVATVDPTGRTARPDQLASELLDTVRIRTTWTPALPASFGGGQVAVELREAPGSLRLEGSASLGHHAATTGLDVATIDGGDRDWLGVDDGTRALPDLVEELAGDRLARPVDFSTTEIEQLGESFSRAWVPDAETADPNLGVATTLGNAFEIGDATLSMVVSGSLENRWLRETRPLRRVTAGDAGLFFAEDYEVDASMRSVLGGLHGAVDLHTSVDTRIELRGSLHQSADDEVRWREGRNEDLGTDVRNQRLRYVERTTAVGALAIHHPLPRSGRMTWRAGLSEATHDEPDHREYEYHHAYNPVLGDHWRLASTSSESFVRSFHEAEHETRSFEVQAEVPIPTADGRRGSITGGLSLEERDRSRTTRRFFYRLPGWSGMDQLRFLLPADSLMTEAYIGGTPDSFRLFEDEEPGYRGTEETRAAFLTAEVPITSTTTFTGGVRWERAEIDGRAQDAFGDSLPARRGRLESDDPFPYAALHQQVGDRVTIQLSAFETIDRPTPREVVPGEGGFFGLPRPAHLAHLDLRIDARPIAGARVSASGFRKWIDDPLATLTVVGGSAPAEILASGDGARITGLELAGKLGLGTIHRSLSSLGVAMNWTVLESWFEGRDADEDDRTWIPGTPPYVVNLAAHWEAPWRSRLILLFRATGKRFVGPGATFRIPDAFASARRELDVSARILDAIEVSIVNVFDEDVEVRQGDEVVDARHPGRVVYVGYRR